MNNDIDFIKQCVEIADGWGAIGVGSHHDIYTPSGSFVCPKQGELDGNLWINEKFPLLISQTADKLGLVLGYCMNSISVNYYCCHFDDYGEYDYPVSYETANEARIAGIKEVLKEKA